MQQDAPPCAVTWLDKQPEEAGHVGSLNRILQEVTAQGFDYLLHLVSGWVLQLQQINVDDGSQYATAAAAAAAVNQAAAAAASAAACTSSLHHSSSGSTCTS
jgi:hypothetical protein